MSGENHILNAEMRTSTGKGDARRARRAGKIPAVIYNHGNAESLMLDVKDWNMIAKSGLHLIDLKKGETSSVKALIKDVQYDYLKDMTIHIDFQEVKMDEIITASITINVVPGCEIIGIAQGGALEQPLHDLEVSCLPAALPESIEVDLSELSLEQSLHVKELKLPEGVTAVTGEDIVVFHIMEQALEEAVTEGEEVNAESAEPQEIEKSKEEE